MKKEKYLKILKIGCIIIIILIIICAYNFGTMRGIIIGSAVVQKLNNETLCDLFIERVNNTFYEDEEGYCVMAESVYDIKMDCYFGKFRVKGNKTMNNIERLAYLPQKIIYYPILRCWY